MLHLCFCYFLKSHSTVVLMLFPFPPKESSGFAWCLCVSAVKTLPALKASFSREREGIAPFSGFLSSHMEREIRFRKTCIIYSESQDSQLCSPSWKSKLGINKHTITTEDFEESHFLHNPIKKCQQYHIGWAHWSCGPGRQWRERNWKWGKVSPHSGHSSDAKSHCMINKCGLM